MNKLLGKNRWKGRRDRRCVGLRWGLLALLMPPLLLIAGCSGCGDSSTSIGPGSPGAGEDAEQMGNALFEIAIDNLNRLEEFTSPEMLQQIVSQLNQWVQTQEPPDDWTLDPLVATLPARFAELPVVQGLDKLEFPRYDGSALQEVIWLRDVSRWARGEKLDELSQAKRLFDWTVRNIQLEAMPLGPGGQAGERIGQMPWETLFFGRGTALERAWVFILVARQQGLDAALLVVAGPDDQAGPPRLFAVGILSQGDVYLFDPVLGLPVPAPDGIKLDDAGQLDIQPATLAQVAADDSLLRRLDFDQLNPYPVRSSDMDRVVALIEASPTYLTQRMKLVESRLAGEQRVVLTTSATAQVGRWKASRQVSDARLWMLPYQTLDQHWRLTAEQAQQRLATLLPATEELWKGRTRYLKGVFTGENGATRFYQNARPSDDQLANLADHYFRLALPEIEKLPEEKREQAKQRIKQAAQEQARRTEPMLRRAKQDASYWLGLLNFELGLLNAQRTKHDVALKNYEVAINYFFTRTLKSSPYGPWTDGANYNLARAYEAFGRPRQAIERYLFTPNIPPNHGNLLRARWLDALRSELEQQKAEDQESGAAE